MTGLPCDSGGGEQSFRAPTVDWRMISRPPCHQSVQTTRPQWPKTVDWLRLAVDDGVRAELVVEEIWLAVVKHGVLRSLDRGARVLRNRLDGTHRTPHP
jgi:hypothetical protein